MTFPLPNSPHYVVKNPVKDYLTMSVWCRCKACTSTPPKPVWCPTCVTFTHSAYYWGD